MQDKDEPRVPNAELRHVVVGLPLKETITRKSCAAFLYHSLWLLAKEALLSSDFCTTIGLQLSLCTVSYSPEAVSGQPSSRNKENTRERKDPLVLGKF